MVGALSDVGNIRRINEDYLGYHLDEIQNIYIVADGMGGHNGGEVASKMAVEETLNYIKSCKDLSLEDMLKNAISCANEKIFKYANSNLELAGMGTTITACLIKNKDIYIANIGDSSCYIIKDGEIKKVTKDHSLVQELIDDGSITEIQAKSHPNKNIITRAMGTGMIVAVDIYKLCTEDVDKIVLCTDGLTNDVMPEEIANCIMNSDNNMAACKELINLAKTRGGRDNISVMIFEGEGNNDWNYARQ